MTERQSASESREERAIQEQVDQRLGELEAQAISESPEAPPYYQYRVEKAPRTFQAVARRSLGLIRGNENWTQGIEGEVLNFNLKIDSGHVEAVLLKNEVLYQREMMLALKVEKAAVLLSFVQSLEYHNEDDERVNFCQPPAFTLAYGGGACDDLAILYASLLEAEDIDYQFVISYLPSGYGGEVYDREMHGLVAVAGNFERFYQQQQAGLEIQLPDVERITINRRSYAYAEPVQGNALIGQVMDGYRVWGTLAGAMTVAEVEDEFWQEVNN